MALLLSFADRPEEDFATVLTCIGVVMEVDPEGLWLVVIVVDWLD